MSSAIETYHCLCSQLLLATTLPLSSCRQRAGESLDKAFILPLNAFPDDLNGSKEGSTSVADQSHHSTLINTVLDRKPISIRRSDGFEFRYQQRCARCNLVVGYHLDNTQYNEKSKPGKREDIIYILPGALALMTAISKEPAVP
jgi:hypothetical protein